MHPLNWTILGGQEKEVTPKFSVEDCQSLAFLVLAQLEVAQQKVNA